MVKRLLTKVVTPYRYLQTVVLLRLVPLKTMELGQMLVMFGYIGGVVQVALALDLVPDQKGL